jgi:DNA-binding MarR family transcriptional regulator
MTTRSRRADLVDQIMRVAPKLVAEGLMFHIRVAERLGLSLVDLRYLQLIAGAGPATAGEIAEATGLTTGAVTRMVDRLEQAGHVRRERDTRDRRRVVITVAPDALATLAPVHDGMANAWREALSAYEEDQLATILDLFERMEQRARREADRLR